MATFQKSLIFLLLLIGLGCKKDPPPQTGSPAPKAPAIRITQIPGTHATLQATYLSYVVDSGFVGTITFIQGWGKAVFKSTNGAELTPKNVATEGVFLKQTKGVYSNSPGSSQGIDFGSEVFWEVAPETNIPAITATLAYKVPEIGELTLGDTLNTNLPLTLAIDLNNAFTALGQVDSVNYRIIGANGNLIRRANSLAERIVEPSEMTHIGKGDGYIQVEAFRITVKDYNGYKVGFINKGVFNKPVWIY